MRILINNKDNTKAVLIADTDDDLRAMRHLFKITWGFYTMWILDKESPIYPLDNSLIGKVYTKFPKSLGIGLIRSPEGFVEEDKVTNKIKQPQEELNLKEKQ